MTKREQEIIDLIHREVKPALGCTEPIAVALAVAKAVEIIAENCPCAANWRLTADFHIDVEVSANILKNGMGVGIPGTGMVGLPVAAALGAVCGDSSLGLEVLARLSPAEVDRAKELVASKAVCVSVADTERLLYVKATVSLEGGARASAEVDPHAYAIIEDDHDRIVETSFADRILMSSESGAASMDSDSRDYGLTVQEIYDFATQMPFEDIAFILEDRTLNLALAREGLDGDYGLKVGKAIRENQQEVFGDDFLTVMDSGNSLVHRIIKKNRNAIGRTDRNSHPRHIRHQSIHALQLIPSSHGICHFPDYASMNLMRLNHIKRKSLIPLQTKSHHIISNLIIHIFFISDIPKTTKVSICSSRTIPFRDHRGEA